MILRSPSWESDESLFLRSQRVHQLFDSLARPLGLGYSRLHGDASSFAGANRRFSVSLTDEVASPSYFQQFSDITGGPRAPPA